MHFISKKDLILPKRKPRSKKGDNGKVLIIGGSKDYVGAVALAGLAALRAGCDWVTVASPEKVAWAINCLSADLVTKKLSGDYFSLRHVNDIAELSKDFDVVLIGNGMGLRDETRKFIKSVIKKIPQFKVIDADAIKVLSREDLKNSIITPHIKELEYFLINSNISQTDIKNLFNEKSIEIKARVLSNKLRDFFQNNNVLLLKGHIDAIISKNKILFNKTGNPGMTKAGTGDVLAGLCAGFLAQSKDLLQSAINGTYFNGLIGDILLKGKKGYCYLASDMVDEIERVVKRLE